MLVILIDVKVRIKFLITMVYWTKWVLTKVSKKAKIKKMEECAAGFMSLGDVLAIVREACTMIERIKTEIFARDVQF